MRSLSFREPLLALPPAFVSFLIHCALAGLAIFNMGFAVVGACLVERVGRRPLWLFSTAGMLCSYVILIAVSATFASEGTKSLGLCLIAFIFICVRPPPLELPPSLDSLVSSSS